MSVMSDSIPSRLVKRTNNLPYLTSEVLKLIRKKHQTFKKASHLATDKAWSKYKIIRNHTTAALKAARSRFLDSLTSKLKSPQDFWKSFHKLSPKRSRIPVDLTFGTDSESTSLGKANLLNSFFASCFTTATSTKSPIKTSPGHPTLTVITPEESCLSKKPTLQLAQMESLVTCLEALHHPFLVTSPKSSSCHSLIKKSLMPGKYRTSTPSPNLKTWTNAQTTDLYLSCPFPRKS